MSLIVNRIKAKDKTPVLDDCKLQTLPLTEVGVWLPTRCRIHHKSTLVNRSVMEILEVLIGRQFQIN
jgi:hypothetical protein